MFCVPQHITELHGYVGEIFTFLTYLKQNTDISNCIVVTYHYNKFHWRVIKFSSFKELLRLFTAQKNLKMPWNFTLIYERNLVKVFLYLTTNLRMYFLVTNCDAKLSVTFLKSQKLKANLDQWCWKNYFSVLFVCAVQLCLTLCNPMDCSPPDSSVYRIFRARILVWVAISFSRGSSQPRDRNCISCAFCIGRQVLYHWCHLGILFSLRTDIAKSLAYEGMIKKYIFKQDRKEFHRGLLGS